MAAPRTPKLATFADLAALGDDARAEIIHGLIVEKAAPSGAHGRTQGRVLASVGRRYDRGPGGRWPGGWWIVAEVATEYVANEVFLHDAAGWRRDRVHAPPLDRPVRIRPDWACEILSPSNEKRDLVDKLRVLHAAAVPHYWILSPETKILTVHRWSRDGYLVVLSAAAGETVHAEPFEAVELRVGVLFGDEDDDE